jgi:ATP-dependent DNA ligase
MRILVDVLPKIECHLLYLNHIAKRGGDLFRAACERELEGIVGKWAQRTYQIDGRSTSWVKIKNPNYLANGRSPRAVQTSRDSQDAADLSRANCVSIDNIYAPAGRRAG